MTDYLDIVLELTQANLPTRNMAYYLSESLLLLARFGRYSAAHLAAACLLTARVLLGIGEHYHNLLSTGIRMLTSKTTL